MGYCLCFSTDIATAPFAHIKLVEDPALVALRVLLIAVTTSNETVLSVHGVRTLLVHHNAGPVSQLYI